MAEKKVDFPKRIYDLLGTFGTASVVGSIPAILGIVLGGGDPKAKALKLFKGKVDAQAGRSSGKALGFAIHKSISAVAAATPEDKRADAVKQAAGLLALQLAQAAELALKFGDAALARENARGKGQAAEERPLAEREAAEEALEQSLIDVGRAAVGDEPKD